MSAGRLGQGLGIVFGAVVALTAMQGSAPSQHGTSLQHTQIITVRRLASSFSRIASRQYAPSLAPVVAAERASVRAVRPENSGIELSGNAARGGTTLPACMSGALAPEVGSILNFRARPGTCGWATVAVVTNVISPRHIEIDHANWGAPGRISRNIDVVDVSPSNDWTDVRVALSQSEDYGKRLLRRTASSTTGLITASWSANSTPMPGADSAGRARPIWPRRPTASTSDAGATAPEEVAEAAEDDSSPSPHYASRRHLRPAGGRTMHANAESPSAPRPYRTRRLRLIA